MSSSDTIETTASTIDQAISQALTQLGAEQEDVTIEVLSTPRSGVLGLGARQARVRVTKRSREAAHSGVMSPPPAPPLRPTPPEMRRPEGRAEVRREPPREPSRPERSERAAEGWREGASVGAGGVRTEVAHEARGEAAREPRREAPVQRDEGRGGERRERPREAVGAADAGGAPRDERRGPEPQERSQPEGRGRREPERQDRRQVEGGDRREPRSEERRDSARAEPSPAGDNGPRREGLPEGAREAGRENGRSEEAPGPGEGRERRSRGGRGRGGRRRQQRATPRVEQPPVQSADARDMDRREADRDDDRDPFAGVDEGGNDPRKIVDLQEQAREATIFLERLLELMGEKATIEQAESDDPETLELNIKGDGSGILIGRHGQTLDAIEYMVNRLLARKIKDAAPISIDTESYRARRRRLLQRMALSKGEQAKREHVGVTLEPMPPRDRRIVHLALKDDPMIATRSTGDGFMRAIEIVPVDERRSPNERGGENRGRGRERDRDQDKTPPIGEQGGFKHGQKRFV